MFITIQILCFTKEKLELFVFLLLSTKKHLMGEINHSRDKVSEKPGLEWAWVSADLARFYGFMGAKIPKERGRLLASQPHVTGEEESQILRLLWASPNHTGRVQGHSTVGSRPGGLLRSPLPL